MSEFSEFELFQPTQNKPQQGSTTAIIFASFCEVIDVFLLIVVVISSWRDYRRSNRSCSCFGFFRTLALMRKVKTRVVRPIFQKKLSRLSEPGRIFAVQRIPFVICPFRIADAKSGKVVQKILRSWHKRACGSWSLLASI